MKAKSVILTAMFLGMLLLTGCWNNRELTQLGIVMAMGVDQGPENEYRVSFQIINPGVIAAGIVGGGAAQAAPVTVSIGTGKTLFEAIRRASEKAPRQLFLSHMQIIVIGETMARKGLNPLLDFFERSHESRLTTHVLVARGNTAESVISVLSPFAKIPADAVNKKLEFSEKLWSEVMSMEIDDVVRPLVSEGSEPIISGVRILGKIEEGKKISGMEKTAPSAITKVQGLGLFKDGKLKRWLDGPEARGVIRIKNKINSTVVNLNCKENKDGVAIDLVASRTEIKTKLKGGKPKFEILVFEEGNIQEVECPLDISSIQVIAKLEKEWAVKTKKEVMAALKIVQKENSDILGLGEAVSREYPKSWEGMKKDWNNIFAGSTVEVKVKSYIRRSSMRMEPYLAKDKK